MPLIFNEGHFLCYFCSMYTLKKSLGQHFLKDETVIDKIIAELKKEPFENLLEIGQGAGTVTKRLINMRKINFKAVQRE